MVKTPKTRHSRPKRDPVTIDHDPGSVSRASDPAHPENTKSGEAGKSGTQPASASGQSDNKAPASASTESGSTRTTAGTSPSETGKSAAGARGKAASTDASSQKSAGASAKTEAAKTETGPSKETSSTASTGKTSSGASGGSGPTGPSTGQRNAAASTPPPARRSGAGTALGAGIVGGIVVLLLAGALQWTGVVPALRPAGDEAQSIAALQRDAESLRSDVNDLKESLGDLQSAAASGDDGLSALQTRLADLESQVSELAGGTQGGQDEQVRNRLSELGQSVQSASGAASANSDQLASLRDRVDRLGERVDSNDKGPQLALVMAASALKSAVDRGAPFATEFETYASVAGKPADIEDLRPYADTGVPTRSEIEAEASDAADRMIAATRGTDATGGVFDRLMASARSLVTVRPVGEVDGDSVSAIAARMEAAVHEGDYQTALQQFDSLPEEAKAVAGDFADKLRARRAADRIVDQALSDALKSA